MKRYYATIFAFLLFCTTVQAQYHNEWIDYNKTYYKIKVPTTGLYRIPYSTLQSAGLPLVGSYFALYNKGQAVPIYVSTDGELSNLDYIEFYGLRNDGSFDTGLFNNANDQIHPNRSLFSDTATYYLTINTVSPNLRFQSTPNDVSNAPAAEPYFLHQVNQTYSNVLISGAAFYANGRNNTYAHFDKNEGWASSDILGNSNQSFIIATPSVAINAPFNATANIKTIGRNNDLVIDTDHHVTISVGATQYGNATYEGYNSQVFNFDIPLLALGNTQTPFTIASVQDLASIDNNALAYIKLNYPRLFNFGNQRSFLFSLPNDTEKYLEIENFNGESAPVLYDLTNLLRLLPVQVGGKWAIKLPPGLVDEANRKLFLSNSTSPLAVTTVNNLQYIQFVDYTQPSNQGNYVIVTHSSLLDAANQYATYRASNVGGSFGVKVVDIDELYDQFAYGIAKHPLAIRHFTNLARDSWGISPEYMLLLGTAKVYSEFGIFDNYNRCLVPTYGSPPSDVLLAARSAYTDIPQLAIGRIPATTPTEVLNYLNKIQQYEASRDDFGCNQANFWRKNMVLIAQEANTAELSTDSIYLNTYKNILQGNGFGLHTQAQYSLLGSNQTATNLNQNLSDGTNILLYTGNSNAGYWQFNVGQPNSYNNTNGRYPFIVSNAGFTGNIHSSNATMGNDYVLAPERGAIGFADNSNARAPEANAQYTQQWLQNLSSTNYLQGVGSTFMTTAQNLFNPNPTTDTERLLKLTCQTYTLAADPSLNITPRLKPEYVIDANSAVFYNPATNYPILSNPPYISAIMPNFEARLVVLNLGKALTDSVNVRVSRLKQDLSLVDIVSQRIATPYYADTVSVIVPNNLSDEDGGTTLYFFVDANTEITESCEGNNVYSKVFEMYLYNSIENINQVPLNIYPNPTNGLLHISTKQLDPANNQFLLFDATGKLALQQTLNQTNNSISVAHLPSGMYWCRLNNKVAKLIIIQ